MDKIETIYNIPEEIIGMTIVLLTTLKFLMQGPLSTGMNSENEIKLRYQINKTLEYYSDLTGNKMPENIQTMEAEIKKLKEKL